MSVRRVTYICTEVRLAVHRNRITCKQLTGHTQFIGRTNDNEILVALKRELYYRLEFGALYTKPKTRHNKPVSRFGLAVKR